jgi:hypothetical protein
MGSVMLSRCLFVSERNGLPSEDQHSLKANKPDEHRPLASFEVFESLIFAEKIVRGICDGLQFRRTAVHLFVPVPFARV